MNIRHILLPGLALVSAGALLLPTETATAYSTIGGSLDQGQRDFRVYNNFSGSSANNNQTPDSQFPGYQGAVMAIWKGVVEWGSLNHGTGGGDPHQPGGLGSGGANFDASFQGEANGVGGSNDNVHSQISGSNGGVLAYCETPISNGWRIRYYQGWSWNDGPGTSGGGIDLQGVACHEYGHALGLGHSGSGGATMYPSISGSGVGQRSIHSDDIAGVKAVYGTASSSKPIITDVDRFGNAVVVTGQNFSSFNNQVWFTQASSGGNGTPVKVTGLSSNGTTLTAVVPGNAGSGDILVRSNGTSHNDLSNAWPFDVSIFDCPDAQNYCDGGANSVGDGGVIYFDGSQSLAANDMVLYASQVPGDQFGVFFYGEQQVSTPFGQGTMCVGGINGVYRLTPAVKSDIFGTAFRAVDFNAPPMNSGSGHITADSTWNFQYWYRDPGFGFNLTDAIAIPFCE